LSFNKYQLVISTTNRITDIVQQVEQNPTMLAKMQFGAVIVRSPKANPKILMN
jgi:hypothetical protein